MYPITIRTPKYKPSCWSIVAHEGERYHVTDGIRHHAWIDGAGTAYDAATGGTLSEHRMPAYVTARIEQEDARDTLRALLSPGDTVTTILRHVSSSGMSRRITLTVCSNGVPRDISRLAARAAGLDFNENHWQIVMGGCGMDMGFSAVYSLSRALFTDPGFICTGENGPSRWCPSNDHSNGSRDYTPHLHSDAGYALLQRWL